MNAPNPVQRNSRRRYCVEVGKRSSPALIVLLLTAAVGAVPLIRWLTR